MAVYLELIDTILPPARTLSTHVKAEAWHNNPQAAQEQYESLIINTCGFIHVVSYCVILKMAMNIKDLYNSGKIFKKINNH